LQEFGNARFLIVPGNFGVLGGAERQALILARALVEDYGCHVDFLGWGGDGILADKVRELGLRPWVFSLPEQQGRLNRIVSLVFLARFIKREIRPDYLLPFVGYHSKIIGSIWRQTGARFTWWNQRDEGRKIYGSSLERRLMRTLPCIISNSFEGRDFLTDKFNLSAERVRVINNGVALPEETVDSNWRKRLNLEPDDVLITMVANLTKYKDHETLLRAFALVRETTVGKRCKLVLAGREGETARDLKVLIYDLRLGNEVEMVGIVDPVSSLIGASDLMVHSSCREGCPNAVLEAMAHCKCVVGTDISGMQQALGSEVATQYLAPPGDVNRLAELITRFAGSPSERKLAGLENRMRIESEFGISRMTEQVLQTILECRIPARK